MGSKNTSGCGVHSRPLEGEAVPERPPAMEQAGTGSGRTWGVGFGGAEAQPLCPTDSQPGRRDRQAGNELGCWKANSQEGATAPRAITTQCPEDEAEMPEQSACLGGLSARNPS